MASDYPDNWAEIADAVKAEAGHKCVRCNEPHNVPGGYTLTVHHFDNDKSNCEKWNLMALCQRCHLSVQGRANVRQQMLYDPTLWAMPYVAGYYLLGKGRNTGAMGRAVLTRWIGDYVRHVGPWPAWAPYPAGRRI